VHKASTGSTAGCHRVLHEYGPGGPGCTHLCEYLVTRKLLLVAPNRPGAGRGWRILAPVVFIATHHFLRAFTEFAPPSLASPLERCLSSGEMCCNIGRFRECLVLHKSQTCHQPATDVQPLPILVVSDVLGSSMSALTAFSACAGLQSVRGLSWQSHCRKAEPAERLPARRIRKRPKTQTRIFDIGDCKAILSQGRGLGGSRPGARRDVSTS